MIAVLILMSKEAHAYSEHDLSLAEQVASQIAGAIMNSQLYADLQCEAKEREALAEIGRIVSSSLDISQVFDQFARVVRELIPIDRMAMTILNPEENTLTNSYSIGVKVDDRPFRHSMSLEGTISGEVARSQKGVLTNMVNENHLKVTYIGLIPHLRAGLHSSMAVPLVSRNAVIGVLHFQSKALNHYSCQNLELAERVGLQIGGAIANAELYEKHLETDRLLRAREEEAVQLAQERAEALIDLRDSREQWRSLVEHAPDTILNVDTDGVIQFINRTAPGLDPERVGLLNSTRSILRRIGCLGPEKRKQSNSLRSGPKP